MLGVLAPQAERGVVARETAVAAARDAAAAEVIARSADAGNQVARPFVSEAQELLGIAAVRRARAKRLRSDAVRAASSGEETLAAFGADAAREEDAEADRLEASVVRAVRSSHDASTFGYVTPEEQKLLSRKGAFESMTIAQRERAMSSILDRLTSEAGNYGRDDDESDEVPGEALDRLRVAADVFGSNLPLVFGAGSFAGIFERMKASRETLEKRLAKKKESLTKAEGKLSALENSGKKGLRVKLLRAHVNRIEKSIEKIQQKLEKLKAAEAKVAKDQTDATKVQTAESAVVTQAATAIGPGGEDMSDQELEEMLSDIETMRLEDESQDADLMAASEVFGFTPIRRRALGRRIHRMRLLEDAARNRKAIPVVVVAPIEAGPRRLNRYFPHYAPYQYRQRRRRMAHLYKWLPGPRVPAPTPYSYPGCARGWYASDLDLPERDVLSSFFRRRAAAYGAENLTPDDVEAFGAGFWEGLSTWWSNLWSPSAERKVERQEKRELRADVREARQAARTPLTPAVIEARKALAEKRGARREAGEAAASAVRRGETPAPTRVSMKRAVEPSAVPTGAGCEVEPPSRPGTRGRKVSDGGGWGYTLYSDGEIFIHKAPSGRKCGYVSRSSGAYQSIAANFSDEFPEATVGTMGGVASRYGLEVPGEIAEWAEANPERAYDLGMTIKFARSVEEARAKYPSRSYPDEAQILEWVIENPTAAQAMFLRLAPGVARGVLTSKLTMGAVAAQYGLEVPSGVEEWALTNPARAYALGMALKDADNETQIRAQFQPAYFPEESKIVEWAIANPMRAKMLFLGLYPKVMKAMKGGMGTDSRLTSTRPHLALGEGARMLAQKLDRVLATEGIQAAIARGLGDQLFDATEAEEDIDSEDDEDLDALDGLDGLDGEGP